MTISGQISLAQLRRSLIHHANLGVQTRGDVYVLPAPREIPETHLELSSLAIMLFLQTARRSVEVGHRQCNALHGERSLQAYLTETIQGRFGAGGGDTPSAILLREVYGELAEWDIALVEEQVANFISRFGSNTFGNRKDRKDIVIYASKAPANRAGRVRRLVDIKANGVHRAELEELISRCTRSRPTAWLLAVVELKVKMTTAEKLQAPHCITRSLQ